MNAAEQFVHNFWIDNGRKVFDFTEMAEMCLAFAASETAAKEAAEKQRDNCAALFEAAEAERDRAVRALQEIGTQVISSSEYSVIPQRRELYATLQVVSNLVKASLSPVPVPAPLTPYGEEFNLNQANPAPKGETRG